jgi:hypothetical protein
MKQSGRGGGPRADRRGGGRGLRAGGQVGPFQGRDSATARARRGRGRGGAARRPQGQAAGSAVGRGTGTRSRGGGPSVEHTSSVLHCVSGQGQACSLHLAKSGRDKGGGERATPRARAQEPLGLLAVQLVLQCEGVRLSAGAASAGGKARPGVGQASPGLGAPGSRLRRIVLGSVSEARGGRPGSPVRINAACGNAPLRQWVGCERAGGASAWQAVGCPGGAGGRRGGGGLGAAARRAGGVVWWGRAQRG